MKLFPLIEHLLIEHNLSLDKSVKDFPEEKIELTKKFIDFVCFQLELKEPCDVILTWDRSNGITTAGYLPDTNKTYVLIKNRLLVDIFRSIAHELKHQEQRELGLINKDSGKDASSEENSANAFAGLMMRKFSKNHPQVYDV